MGETPMIRSHGVHDVKPPAVAVQNNDLPGEEPFLFERAHHSLFLDRL